LPLFIGKQEGETTLVEVREWRNRTNQITVGEGGRDQLTSTSRATQRVIIRGRWSGATPCFSVLVIAPEGVLVPGEVRHACQQ